MANHTRSLRKRSPARGAGAKPGTVVVENVVRPGTSRSVAAGKYGAMRQVLLRVLPQHAPGMTLADALAAVLPLLPQALFPEGAAAGWWFKTVQLDLEAKRQIVRGRTSPIRLYRI